MKAVSTTTRYLLQLLAIAAGITISLYLLVQHTELKTGIQESASFCSINSIVDCDVVNASDYSELFGIPIAALGAFFYFTLLSIALLFPPGNTAFFWGQGQLGRLTLLGLIVDAYLFVIQLVVLRNFCIMCLLTYVVTAIVFIGAFHSSEQSKHGITRYLKMLMGPKFAPSPTVQAAHFGLALVAIGTFLAVVAIIPSSVRSRSQSYELVNRALDQFFEQWKELPARKFPVKPGDGTAGNPSAKVQIVEFSDYQCPYCKKAAFTLHTAMSGMKDKIQLVFKNYPLDSNCNPSVKMQIHPHACTLARLAFCANKKEKFWEFHDAVFFNWTEEAMRSKSAVEDSVRNGALSRIFSEKEYRDCLNLETATANVLEDIKLGAARDVDRTPMIFINGKRVTIPVSLENLRKLVEIENNL